MLAVPATAVWSQAKALLSEEGYSMMEAQGRYELEAEAAQNVR
ncbi:hypothetical protein [Stigmatella aurantiaca]|nr:hypothetical protein [Stigmatella aurantiaca]